MSKNMFFTFTIEIKFLPQNISATALMPNMTVR